MQLFCFIIRISHDARSAERERTRRSLKLTENIIQLSFSKDNELS